MSWSAAFCPLRPSIFFFPSSLVSVVLTCVLAVVVVVVVLKSFIERAGATAACSQPSGFKKLSRADHAPGEGVFSFFALLSLLVSSPDFVRLGICNMPPLTHTLG